MPLHPDADPLAVSTTVVTLRPDGLVLDFEKEPGTCLDLAELFSGPPAYDTLRLRYGLEMHHHLGSTEAPNAAASRFAEHCGYEPIDIRGTVWFTGASAETDSAPGMDDAMYLELFETLSAVSDTHGLRLRSQYRPHETVFVKPTDYAPGDTLWLGQPHRFMRLADCPSDSVTAQLFPGARYFQCDDRFTMGATAPSYPTRADQAPPGYWQRTGHQLLPASD
ncbi:hypothetical protein GCM10017744_103290 [Streptomyces antimycoticus]|uniref:hypothetical protein n=2 Tax=Streptomyces antimycoticus TaxID=68175 RepID=UPI0031EB7C9B